MRNNNKQAKTVKAKITSFKPRFIKKVSIHQETVKDALNPRFRSFFSIFVPKLNPKFLKPCVMLHIGNGGGSVLIRFNRPTDLANFLTKIIKYLRSNKLNEDFEHLEFIAEKIKDGDEVAYDKQFIEM